MWLLDCRCGCTARWSLFSTRGSDTPSMRSATTAYLDTLHAKVGTLEPYATSIGGWTAGDHGLSRADAVSLDLPQMLTNYQTDPGHVARLCVHEMTHAYSRDRSTNPPYWADFSVGASRSPARRPRRTRPRMRVGQRCRSGRCPGPGGRRRGDRRQRRRDLRLRGADDVRLERLELAPRRRPYRRDVDEAREP